MPTKANLLCRVEAIAQKLADPITSSERAVGWSDTSRMAMLDYFKDLHRRLELDQGLTPADFSITRGMDHWGITGGALLDEAAEISCRLREFSNAKSAPNI